MLCQPKINLENIGYGEKGTKSFLRLAGFGGHKW